jgi:hypothetical protein
VAYGHEPTVDARAAGVLQNLCENYEDECRRTVDYTDTMRVISDQLAHQMPTVREILKRLGPTLAQGSNRAQYLGGASNSLRAGQQGLGILGDQDEWAANSPGRALAHRRPVPPARLAGRVGPMGHRPVPSCRGTGDGLAVGAHRRKISPGSHVSGVWTEAPQAASGARRAAPDGGSTQGRSRRRPSRAS